MSSTASPIVHLRAGGVSIVLDVRGPRTPRVIHWGAELSESDAVALLEIAIRAVPNSAGDIAAETSLLPQESEGFLGHPALSGSRHGQSWSPEFTVRRIRADERSATIEVADDAAQLGLVSTIEITESGLVTLSHRVINTGTDDYTLEELAGIMPVPGVASELFDLAGRWGLERQPQRHPFASGSWLREQRHGRTGFDAPLVMAVGSAGFGNRTGQVWGVHFAWSGNARIWAERTLDGQQSLAAAELFGPGGLNLAPGEEYRTPVVFASWSADGLDGVSRRFHRYLRGRPNHPRSARPVVFNSWEAVYFRHDMATISRLADVAASFGAERFVLDDGWFLARRDDSAGLGDWSVDKAVWPDGLGPLADHVHRLGMQFGIWVEPEMVNPDSDLYRAHPDWILAVPDRTAPRLWRNQYVLDVGRPEVYDYLLTTLDGLLNNLQIEYFKWDHNRDLLEAGAADGTHGVHAHTLAVYRLIDELRRRHPGLEIESCSSGGGRVDLGILERTDRVWGSDSNDALDRHSIQRWTSVLLPPELVGSHVGPPTAHMTGRTHSLAFRATGALFGSFGIEWDIASATAEETAGLSEAIELYKRFRGLIHSGDLVHADLPDPSATFQGVVARDQGEALFAYTQIASAPVASPARCLVPGLDPDTIYRLRHVDLEGAPRLASRTTPPWWTTPEVLVSGSALANVGLAIPGLHPEQAVLIHLERVS